MLKLDDNFKECLKFISTVDYEYLENVVHHDTYFSYLNSKFIIGTHYVNYGIYDDFFEAKESRFLHCYGWVCKKSSIDKQIKIFDNNKLKYKKTRFNWLDNKTGLYFSTPDEHFNYIMMNDSHCSLTYNDFLFIEQTFKDFDYDVEIYL